MVLTFGLLRSPSSARLTITAAVPDLRASNWNNWLDQIRSTANAIFGAGVNYQIFAVSFVANITANKVNLPISQFNQFYLTSDLNLTVPYIMSLVINGVSLQTTI